MDQLVGPNVPDPAQFAKSLQDVLDAIHKLFEATKEYDWKPVTEDGVRTYYEEEGKCGFQAAYQYERPTEFLQCLLDIMRVHFEPRPMGTLFLNSNIGFMYQELPEEPFQLAYASLVSRENQSFSSFFADDVSPYLEQRGYDAESITAMFAVASTGHERYKMKFVSEIAGTLKSGFSVDEVLGLMASSIDSAITKPNKQTYSGYCLDPALGTRIRLSLWCFSKVETTPVGAADLHH